MPEQSLKLIKIYSVPVLNRCVPEVAKDVGIYFLNESWNFVEELIGDLYRTWKWILYLTIFSVGMLTENSSKFKLAHFHHY